MIKLLVIKLNKFAPEIKTCEQHISQLIDEIAKTNNITRKLLRSKIKQAFINEREYALSKTDIKRLCRHEKAKYYYFVPIGCIKIIDYLWDNYKDIAQKYKTSFLSYINYIIGKTIYAVEGFAKGYKVGCEKDYYEEERIIKKINEDVGKLRRILET